MLEFIQPGRPQVSICRNFVERKFLARLSMGGFLFSSRDLTTKVKLRSSSHRKCFSSRYSCCGEIDVLILIWEFSPSKHHRVAVEDVARASKAFLRYLLNVENLMN